MKNRTLLIVTFIVMLLAIGMPKASADPGDSPEERIDVSNYDHGWKAEYLVSHVETAPCWYTNTYEWVYKGVYYVMTEGDNDPCYYDVVVPIPRDPMTLGNRPFIKKYNCVEKAHRKAIKKHHGKRWARHHRTHMTQCH